MDLRPIPYIQAYLRELSYIVDRDPTPEECAREEEWQEFFAALGLRPEWSAVSDPRDLM